MFIVLMVVLLNIAILIFPQTALTSAGDGLRLWLNNVLPALLPFAIGVNILSGFGFTRYLGVLLEPVMQPLFRVPGSGGFALAMGLFGGTPLGAKITADLRREGLLTRREARKLSAFSNCMGPMFVVGVVGVGIFGDAAAGYFLFFVHVLAALLIGFIFRWFGGSEREKNAPRKRMLTRAHSEMMLGRGGGKSFGQVLADSTIGAMETMLMVGGFIILFSVIIGMLGEIGLFGLIDRFSAPWLSEGVVSGLVEVTYGVRGLGFIDDRRIALISAAGLISFGGFCIHAQSIGFLGKTDIGSGAYLVGKTLHSAFAVGLAALFYPIYKNLSDEPIAVSFFAHGFVHGSAYGGQAGFLRPLWVGFRAQAFMFSFVAIGLAMLSLAVYFLRRGLTKKTKK